MASESTLHMSFRRIVSASHPVRDVFIKTAPHSAQSNDAGRLISCGLPTLLICRGFVSIVVQPQYIFSISIHTWVALAYPQSL